jgi:hypothetical protein
MHIWTIQKLEKKTDQVQWAEFRSRSSGTAPAQLAWTVSGAAHGYTGPRRWRALGQALRRHRGGRSAQRCRTTVGSVAALSNGGSPVSGASTWTPAPGMAMDTAHEERQWQHWLTNGGRRSGCSGNRVNDAASGDLRGKERGESGDGRRKSGVAVSSPGQRSGGAVGPSSGRTGLSEWAPRSERSSLFWHVRDGNAAPGSPFSIFRNSQK